MSQVVKEDSEYDGEKPKFSEPRIRRTKYVKWMEKIQMI